MGLSVTLPAVRSRLADHEYRGLDSHLAPLRAILRADRFSQGHIYRLGRQAQVNFVAAAPVVPSSPGGYVWARNGPFFGTVSFAKSLLLQGLRRMVSGRLVEEQDDWVTYASQGTTGIVWEDLTYRPPTPEIPAVDAQTIVTGRMGWDGGGRGRDFVRPGDRLVFRINRSVAVQGGLARPGAEYAFATPKYAWYRHGDALECVENGVVVAVLSSSIPDSSIEGWRFGIERTRDGEIRWVFYTSASEGSLSTLHSTFDDGGPLVPMAMPYTSGDSIDALSLKVAPNTLQMTLPAVRARLGETVYAPSVQTRLARIHAQLVSFPTADLNAPLPAVRSRLGLWAGLNAEMPGWSVSMRSEPTFEVNDLLGLPAPIRANMTGLAGAFGNINAMLAPMLTRIEEQSHARIRAWLPALSTRMSDFHRDFGLDYLTMAMVHDLDNPLLLVTVDGLDVGDDTTISVILNLEAADGLQLTDDTSLGELVELLVNETVYANDGGYLARREALQYAVNLLTGAPSVYQGFDFRGFLRVGDVAYAWRPDGLYRLGEDRDGDRAIRALVDFGTSDYGTAQSKRMTTAWLGLRTDGQVYLRVRNDEGRERVYRPRKSPMSHKALLAKGLAGRKWSVTLELEDASFATLDSLEIEVSVMQRRFGGR